MSTGVTLFSEEELLEFVEYWGGDLSRLSTNQLGRGRGLAALTFYLLHHPSSLPERMGWGAHCEAGGNISVRPFASEHLPRKNIQDARVQGILPASV